MSMRRRSMWRHKKPSTAWKASYVVTSISGLPAMVGGFFFVPMWGMCTTRIILRCFSDKDMR